MRADKITETQGKVGSAIDRIAIEDIRAEYQALETKFEVVQERLAGMDAMVSNAGWNEIYGVNSKDGGPSLEQLLDVSEQLQALTAQNAWLKRGNLLRTNYVWDGGIHYENISSENRGKGVNVQALIDDEQNQREFFGPSARKRRSKALYTDGHAIYMGDDRTKKLKAIPLNRVTGTLVNPEDSTEVWALHVTTPIRTNTTKGERSEWVFLNGYTDLGKGMKLPQSSDPIAQDKRIFIRYSNPTIGWTWGVPDALAAMAWVRQYREFLLSGKKMSDAMAMLWAQVKSPAQVGAANASVQFSSKQGAGGVAIGGPEVAPLSTAGKGYEFDTGRALLAAAATALEVSVVALASDPGAAGSSYGSAQTLDLPGRMAISAIREDEAEFDEIVLRWMGAKEPKAWFNTLLDGEALYRLFQAEGLYWNFGLRDGKEQKTAMDKIKGKPVSEATPDGLMIPNNEKYAGTLSNDTQPTQTAAPDQGQSNGTGGNSTAVTRKDVISK